MGASLLLISAVRTRPRRMWKAGKLKAAEMRSMQACGMRLVGGDVLTMTVSVSLSSYQHASLEN